METKHNIDRQLDAFLDEVMQTSPECSLSSDFAEKVKRKVYATFLWKRYLKEFFTALFIALLVVLVAFGILAILNIAFVKNSLAYIVEYRTYLLFALAMLVILFFYNYVLLDFMLYYYKKRLSKS